MKTTIFLSMLLLSSIYLLAQETTFNYDFKTSKWETPKPKTGDKIFVRINNYNRLLFSLKNNVTDSVIAARIETQNIFGTFSNISNLSGLISGLISTIGTAGKQTIPSPDSLGMKFNQIVKKCPPEPDAKQLQLNTYFKSEQNKIRGFMEILIGAKDTLEQKSSITLSAAQKELKNPYANETTLATCKTTIDNLKADFLNNISQIKQIGKNIRTAQYDYLDSIGHYYPLITADKTNWSIDSLIKAYYRETLQKFGQLDTLMSYQKIEGLFAPFDYLQGIDNPVLIDAGYYEGPGTIKKIELAFTPHDNNQHYLPDFLKTSMRYPVVNKHSWGITGGPYVSSLSDTRYSNMWDSASPSQSGYRLIKENDHKIEMGVNVLAYYNCQLNNTGLAAGPVIGAGTVIQSKLKPRVFVGGNISIGNRNKFLISAGVVLGQVTTLSDAYSTTKYYEAAQDNYMKEVLKARPFIGISYSFINGN